MSWTQHYLLYDPEAGGREELTGLVTDFQRFSIHDGPGIRTIVFLKGCPLRCAWCANPETISPRPEIMHIPHNCIGCGKCVQACPERCFSRCEAGDVRLDRTRCLLPGCGACQRVCYANAANISGRYLSVDEVMEVVLRDREFYERTGGGVTFSGGEPFAQPRFLGALAQTAKERLLDTAVETCGHVSWETMAEVLSFLDRVLMDVKHSDPEAHRRGTGVDNRLILENLKKLDGRGIPLRIRLPLIPGFNDTEENVRATAKLVSGLKNIEALDILPYHRMGEPKWSQVGRTYDLHGLAPHGAERVYALAGIAREYGIEVTIGG
jgi:pyruvate formate lyase activating enzyme